eukprot:CCRYP_019609-RA/>CCRYP_019609-RA protein AED:0.25 eAED:0.25 QI:87/1/1/1/1/1/2/424/586
MTHTALSTLVLLLLLAASFLHHHPTIAVTTKPTTTTRQPPSSSSSFMLGSGLRHLLSRQTLFQTHTQLHMQMQTHPPPTKQIAIIGAGAAGLAAARAFLRRLDDDINHNGDDDNPRIDFQVSVLEMRSSLGGIWDYDETGGRKHTKSRPMYQRLRTNLPKELMAFREFPWGDGNTDNDGGTREESYVSHRKVQRYLEDYAEEFGLKQCIRFGCTVEQLTVLNHDDDDDDNDVEAENHDNKSNHKNNNNNNVEWPRISLQWKQVNENNTILTQQQTFDTVCICNGHYSLPSIPALRGLSSFRGRILHAIQYDQPDEFTNQTVLCVGARASGMDIAREIASVARVVYLSDSTCRIRKEFGKVVCMPRTSWVDEEGGVHFSSGEDEEEEEVVYGIDVILFCSGYDYDFPFINEDSNLDLQFVLGERRVMPLYEQLWHARYPSLSFIGLPHSVVPFPLFEIQANAVRIASELHYSGQSGILPSLAERLEAAERDASSGGPESPGRVQDTHYLGSHQWEYCRKLAKLGRFYDQSLENYIATNKEMYDCSGRERKAMVPGGEDTYRQTRFTRDDDRKSYRILYSEMSSTQPV